MWHTFWIERPQKGGCRDFLKFHFFSLIFRTRHLQAWFAKVRKISIFLMTFEGCITGRFVIFSLFFINVYFVVDSVKWIPPSLLHTCFWVHHTMHKNKVLKLQCWCELKISSFFCFFSVLYYLEEKKWPVFWNNGFSF